MAHNIAGWLALGWPDIIFENLAQTTCIPGWGSPSIKSFRSAQPPTDDQRPPLLTAGAGSSSGCQYLVVATIVVTNLANAVISDDRELGLLRNVLCSAANKFLLDRQSIRTHCLVLIRPPTACLPLISLIYRNFDHALAST